MTETEIIRQHLQSKHDTELLAWASFYIAGMQGLANVCPTFDVYSNFSQTFHACLRTHLPTVGLELDRKFLDCAVDIAKANNTLTQLNTADRVDSIINTLFERARH